MKIKRTFDSDLVNSIIRHPDIFPLVKDDSFESPEDFDCQSMIANSRNVVLSVLDDKDTVVGVFIFIALNDTTFEVHTNLLSKCRKNNALAAAVKARDFMFTATPCSRLVTRVPEFNKPAFNFSKLNGFEVDFIREKSFSYNKKLFNQTFLSLDIYSWMRIVAMKFQMLGEKFHSQLEKLKNETGIGEEVHDVDKPHDVTVGISLSMMLAGQISKSEYYFNEWASLAGYSGVKHLGINNDNEHILDIGEAIISIDRNLTVKGV